MGNHPFEFRIHRKFDAPREIVWKAWTDAEKLKAWFGPKGCPIFFSQLDLRPGGTYHYGMRMPDGGEMWGRWIFREIQEPERLVFVMSFSDPAGHTIARHPWEPNWPLEVLSIITFQALGPQTEIRIQWEALNPSEIERKTFEAGAGSMQQGWTGTFEQFTDYLQRETGKRSL